MWSPPADVARVLPLVVLDDLDPHAAVILAAIRRLVGAGKPHSPQLVDDELVRAGELKSLVAERLRNATTSGADIGSAVRHYAAATVAGSLRRRIAAAGDALTASAESAPEADLQPLVARAVASIADCAERLRKLRGEDG